MFYTVVPIEDILDGIEKEPALTMELSLGGLLLEVEPQGDFTAKIVRIISSNPQDYLHNEYQPGAVVRWT